MSVQAIIDKIKEDTKAEAEAILAEAENKCAEINKEIERQVNEINSELSAKLKKQQDQLETVAKSLEKQKANLALQSAKRKLLDSVYADAWSEVLNLSASDYIKLLLNKSESLLPKRVDIKSVQAPENRQTETAEIMKLLGIEAEMIINPKLKGGFILVGRDFEYNFSLENIFAEERKNSEIEIANILFDVK